MHKLLQIIHITLVAVSKAVFDYWYLMIVWIVYLLIKKMRRANIYRLEERGTSFTALMEALFQGVIAGIVGSLTIVLFGLPIHLSLYLIFLLPISLLLSLIRLRFICLTYSAAFLGGLAMLLRGQMFMGIQLPNIDININGLMALVGVFHLMESILVFFAGANDCIPVLSKNGKQVIMGHILQKYWPIPIAILFATTGEATGGKIEMPIWWPALKITSELVEPMFYGLMPMVGVLGYSVITFTEEPEKQAKKTAGYLFVYSCIVIAMSTLIGNSWISNLIGLLVMVFLHDGIMLYQYYEERKREPVYPLPKQGIRIMDVVKNGLAEKAGLKIGMTICKINNIEVQNVKHFREIMNERLTYMWIEAESIDGKIDVYEIKAYPYGTDNIGIQVMPENPRLLFKYGTVEQIGLIHLIRKRYKG